jgi:O-antigen/teichoic acid export membrane protein
VPAVAEQTARRPNTVMANTAVLAGYAAFEMVVVFLFTVLLARYLGAQEFGRLGFALSYALLFSVLSDPGISIAMTKLVATSQGDRQSMVVGTGLALRLMLSGAIFGVSLVPFAFSAYMRESAGLIVAVMISEHLRNLALYLCCVFRGHQRNEYEALTLSVERIGCLLAGWILLRAGFGTYAIGLLYLFARLASLGVAISIYARRFVSPTLNLNRDMLQRIRTETYPLAVLVICERVNIYLPPILVTVIAGQYATGIFQAAFKAVMPALMLSTAVAGSLYAPMASRFTQDPAASARLYHAGVRGLLHLLLPVAVITILLPQQVILVLYGAEYLPATTALRWLTPYFVSVIFIAINHLFMPAIDRQKIVGIVSVISVVLNVALGVWLIRMWHATGAAISLLLAQAVVATVYISLAQRYGRAGLKLQEWLTILLSFTAALLAVGAVRAELTPRPLIALLEGASISALAYLLTLALLRGISSDERNALRRITGKLLPKPA